MSRAVLGAVLFCITTGCGTEGAQLFVTVRTDWVPGVEFGGVSVRLDEPSGASTNVAAFVTDDYAAGVRVAALSDLAPGTHHLVVTLLETESGAVLDEENVRVDLREGASLAVTVVLTREAQTCSASTECSSPIACVEGSCVDRACLFAPRMALCGPTEYCDPDRGCTALPVIDAGVDAGDVRDGGTPPSDGGAGCSGPAFVWRRSLDWVDGTAHGTSGGNPAQDSDGRPTWFFESTSGGPLGDSNPWYGAAPTLLLWDESWFGADGAWSATDDIGPLINASALTHITAPSVWANVPRIRWQNATGAPMMMTVSGRLDIFWSGIDEAAPIDVDMVVAKLRVDGAPVEELFAMTVSKPTDDPSFESSPIVVPARTVMMSPDESIAVSIRARVELGSIWIEARDDLSYIGVPCRD